ncbi:pyridoxal kinase PdxY [Caenispirillum salinarum]|uniref:pyridoxal kinase PdxY n=1 Tax=Caenispirillum salinarum TaxID=859058 RepID=UPI00384C9E0F
MAILSIQSHVAYGHVGNSAAVFPLQRLGNEVWPVHTVHFSNHTGYETVRGTVLGAALVRDTVRGIGERGVLGRCDALLSGYLGDAGIGHAVVEAADTVKAANPDAIYCCDPVMGDHEATGGPGGLYVKPDIPDLMRDVVIPRADLATPNQFELELLTGRPCSLMSQVVEAVDALRAMGPKVVMVTSLRRCDADPQRIEVLARGPEGAWLISTPRIPLAHPPTGSGDAFAALFLGHFLRSRRVPEALEAAVNGLFSVFEATERAGGRELALIEAQDALATPVRRFRAEPLPVPA